MALDLKKIIPYGVLATDKNGDLAKLIDVFGAYYDDLKKDADGVLNNLGIDDCPPYLLKHIANYLRAELFSLNMFKNPTFELDANNDGFADNWSLYGTPAPTAEFKQNSRGHTYQRVFTTAASCGIRQTIAGLDISKRVILTVRCRVNTPNAVLFFGTVDGTGLGIGINYSENLSEWKTYSCSFVPTLASHEIGIGNFSGGNVNFDVDFFFVDYLDEIDKMKQWIRNCVSVYKKKGTKQALIDVVQYLTDWTPTITENFVSKFFQVYNWEGSNYLNQVPVFNVEITDIDSGDRRTLTVDVLWGDDPTGQSNVGLCIIPNPSFEEVTSPPTPDYWIAVGSPTLAIVKGFKGKNAIKITPNDTAKGLKSTAIQLDGGSDYTFTVAVKKVSGSAPTIKLRNTTESTDDIILTLTDVTDEFLVYTVTDTITGSGTKNCEAHLLGNLGDVFEVDEVLVKPASQFSFDYWCWLEPDTLSGTNLRQKNHVESIYISSSPGGSQVLLGEDVAGNWTTGRLKGMTWEMQSIESEIDAGAYYYFETGVEKEIVVTLSGTSPLIDDARKEMLETILLNYLPVGVILTIQY